MKISPPWMIRLRAQLMRSAGETVSVDRADMMSAIAAAGCAGSPPSTKIEVIAGQAKGSRAEAILGPVAPPTVGATWSGAWSTLHAVQTAGRLVPRAIFDAELSARWSRLVVCTPEFSSWWRRNTGRPAVAFFLEVISE